MNQFDVIIIGAGPAGLLCAIEAAARGYSTCILEKNHRPGKKLLLSGSGRCNITHSGTIDDFLPRYGKGRRFLRAALHGFTNHDLTGFLRKRGCPVTTTEGGKIFPASQHAGDVLEVFLSEADRQGVTIFYDRKAAGVSRQTDCFFIDTGEEVFHAAHLVIATGGISYPGTGSTGDGYELARSLGHGIVEPLPALTPVIVREYRYRDCAGISIRDAEIHLYHGGKKKASSAGDILFTHRGLSGPGILDFSRHIRPGDLLKVSLLPARGRDELEKHLIEQGRGAGKTSLKKTITDLGLPERLARHILKILEIPENIKMGEVSRTFRGSLLDHVTAHPFPVERLGNFNEAMVTAGGVSRDEINQKTMESKLVPGLYFAGEVIDIDGDTGGYNLQAAFSTGALAGRSIIEKTE